MPTARAGTPRLCVRLVAGAVSAIVFVSCGGGPSVTKNTGTAGSPATATVWLCRPGAVDDPCTFALTTTVVESSGARSRLPSVAVLPGLSGVGTDVSPGDAC